MKIYKKYSKYFSQHTFYNSVVHLSVGIGVGILITYPYINAHPLRWGLVFLAIGLIGHVYPLLVEK